MFLIVLADHLTAILSDFPGISLVYVFGSQVKGDVGPMSDYDLAIFNESGQDELDVQAGFQQVLGKYGDYLPTLRVFQQQTLHGDAHAKRVQRYREALRRTQRTLDQAGISPQSTSP